MIDKNDDLPRPYRFDLYARLLPERIHEKAAAFLLALRDHLTGASRATSLVVAYSSVSWTSSPASVQLHAVAQFDSLFEYLDSISDILAPAYLQYQILPLVYPYVLGQWEMLPDAQPRLFSNLARRGVLAFSYDRAQ